MKTSPEIADRSSKRGVALIIVLAFVVLLTGLSVAFLSRSTTDRQVAHSSFNDTDADVLAASALDIVVTDLRREIINGSTTPTPSPGDQVTVYTPTLPAYMVPMRSGTPASGTPIPNLIRRSVYPDNISAPGVASRASNLNSTVASINGRSVGRAKWNRHYLIPRISPTPSTDGDATPTSSFVAPDWVLVTRNGPTSMSGWTASLKDPTATNANYVTGRYAYAIYDEGGLIDANVAGYPSAAPSPATYVQTIGRKGGTYFADLTQTTMTAGGIGGLLGWRNYATVQPGGAFINFTFDSNAASRYVSAILSNSNAFLTISSPPWNNRTDQAFTTRQSLIQFQRSSVSNQFKVGALEFLGTFSRECNRPSWTPILNATDMGAANNGPGNIYAYRDNAGSPTAINRNLSTVRVTTNFVRADGTTAVIGEPLLKTRFPLTRINELTNTANAFIQRDFGLQWDSANNRWNYVGATGSTLQSSIKTLSAVASENREPNFFEVLKTVILNGSVGSGSTATFVGSEQRYYDTTGGLSADYQIMQIGANIIDNWDADNIPTFIYFANNELAGVENLPYLNKLVLSFLFTNNGHDDLFYSWLVPSLWNPHQNAAAAPAAQDVRFAMTSGSMNAVVKNKNGGTIDYFPTNPIPSPSPGVPYPYIQVKANAFKTACPPVPSPAQSPAPDNERGSPAKVGQVSPTTQGSGYYDGLYFGVYTDTSGNGSNSWKNVDQVYAIFAPGTSFEMQVNINGTWKAYQSWKSCNNGTQNIPLLVCQGAKKSRWKANTGFKDPEFVTLDPRTIRFGVWGSDTDTTGNDTNYGIGAEDTMDENSTGLELVSAALRPQPTASFPTTGKIYWYSTNGTAGDRYADLDGVTRRGDWTTDVNGTTTTKSVMYSSPSPSPTPKNSQDRPQILSAPFQSVAELGQVFRDQPWKTLNFSTAASADAGLLDVFTLQDVPMVAGRASLNTRQTAVLSAIISQSVENLAAGAVVGKTGTSLITITPADVTTIANRLSALTTGSPMLNKADLVTRLMEDATLNSSLWTNSPGNPWNKESRELVVRALSDATQTRTWNLMIDVIAQSGRYPPTASNLSQFVVEGEKRYWLHIAIDRFTGEIIDQQLELVNE